MAGEVSSAEVVVVQEMVSLMDRVQEKCAQPVPTAKIFTDLSSASDSLCDEDAADQLHEDLLRDPGEMSLEEGGGVENKKRGDVEGKGPDMEQARQFATANGMSLVHLKQLGKNLGLSITKSSQKVVVLLPGPHQLWFF